MNRVKTEKVVFTFPTTTQALRMEQKARERGSLGRLIPVPREISAGCGMAWSAPAAEREKLEQLAREHNIQTEGVHKLFLRG